jgi:RecJ-like exonuclease
MSHFDPHPRYDPWLDTIDEADRRPAAERPCKRCRGLGTVDGADCVDCEGWGSVLL